MSDYPNGLEFFGSNELACKGTGVIKLDPNFAEELPKLRRAWGRPMILNSVCRAPSHNKAVGGHPSSLHLTENPKHPSKGAMAADVRWRGWPVKDQLSFARLAFSMGWAVGLHDGFCHIDRRGDIGLAQNVFLYGTWSWPFTPQDVRA